MSIVADIEKYMYKDVNMPNYLVGPYGNTAGWWAVYILELGSKNEYALVDSLLTVAQKCGALNDIRLACEQIMLLRLHITKQLKREERKDNKREKESKSVLLLEAA